MNIIISGASCTNDSPWQTWADLVDTRYGIKSKNIGRKGLGNEAIITGALAEALNTDNPIIAIMLTSVDKWDWYTQDKGVLSSLKDEKHKGYRIRDEDDGAYWCTGSHFPLWKQHYHKHYYSLRNMTLNTIKHIDLLVKTCKSKGWEFFIGADHGIFAYTESQYTHSENIKMTYDIIKQNNESVLIDNVLRVFYNEIKDHVDLKGMIKMGDNSGLPVVHGRYKLHPGTAVHHEYCKQKVFPFLDKYLPIKNNDLNKIVVKEQNLWDETNT
jgi:hypothetical protein|tara:strand:+ start:47 stop:856 length:810 start_codon:yes stop_codon:yes gene_type:complete